AADGNSWLIKVAPFGPTAVAEISSATSIDIRDITLPSGFRLSLRLNFELSRAGWTVEGNWGGWNIGPPRRTSPTLLVDILKDVALETPLANPALTKFLKSCVGSSVSVGKTASLALNHQSLIFLRT